MGWNSIQVADDTAKRVFFCMKEFGGICNSVDYAYLYESMGSKPDYGKTYQGLADLQKSMSPFFRNKVSMKRVIPESYSNEIIQRYKKLGMPCFSGECEE